MLLTKETDYALRILRALADGNRLTTKELANDEQIPHQFAYKILKKLQNGGIVSILRGADGGCTLAIGLEKLSLFQLMQVMEDDSYVSSCMKAGYQCSWCKAHGNAVCHAHTHLSSIQKNLDEELDSHSLREILFGG